MMNDDMISFNDSFIMIHNFINSMLKFIIILIDTQMSQESQNQKSQKTKVSKDSRLKESKTQIVKTKIMSQCDPKVSCPCPLLHCIALFGH